MRRKAALLPVAPFATVVALMALTGIGCARRQAPEAFGLRAGMTEEQVVSAVGASSVQAREDDGLQGQYLKLDSAPNGDPAFDVYGCVFSRRYGLVEVYADDFGDRLDGDDRGEPEPPRFPGPHASAGALRQWQRADDAWESAEREWKTRAMAADFANDRSRIGSALDGRYESNRGEWRGPWGTRITYDGSELTFYFPHYQDFESARSRGNSLDQRER